ncbi:MAG: 50S ribosomal protein L11 methyltransferase [Firmicutes bacterium]|nr:50S ribosomal protein L11 methyltransferase [Bacillota bacterium]
MKWLEVTVRVLPTEVELAGNLFLELGSGGVIVADPASVLDPRVRVTGYFPVDRDLPARMASLRRYAASVLRDAGVVAREVGAADWANWREAWRPRAVGRRLLVRPPWAGEGPEWACGRLVVEIEPGPAFGYDHPTTLLCLEFLEESIRGGERVADVGTGSGILAIAAARLGAGRVLAVDSDPVAVRAARENVARNSLSERVAVREGHLLDGVAGPLDIVVANLASEAVAALLPAAARVLAPGGRLIVSGLTARGRDGVTRGLAGEGFRPARERTAEGWVALLAERG